MNIKKAAAGLLMAAFATATTLPATAPALAQQAGGITAAQQQAMEYSRQVHLAYIANPSLMTNDDVRRGLENLNHVMTQRTAIQPAGVVELDVESDDLYFFPFIYWAVTTDTPELSREAQQRVQEYLQNGGMILFDTRDQGMGGQSTQILQNLLRGLNLRPLENLDQDHVLTKSFYLVQNAPGTVGDSPVWVEEGGTERSETISSVIIGGNDWAGAWGGITVSPQSRDHEMALRAGINMVMHALTGNYKQDMVHIDRILQRMQPY